MHDAAVDAKARFDAGFPRLLEWFHEYDPLYVLSFCVFYLLTAERGVDKEAIDGKVDFGSHHLELLQAFALVGPRLGTPQPLRDKAVKLQETLRELSDPLALSHMDIPPETPDEEVKKRFVIEQMRAQTFAVRNWAFPEQALRHTKSLFSGGVADAMASQFGDVAIPRVVDMLVALAEDVNNRINAHTTCLDIFRDMHQGRPIWAGSQRNGRPDDKAAAWPRAHDQNRVKTVRRPRTQS